MAACGNCGLSTGTKYRSHEKTSECLTAAKEALNKLARYRLLDGDEEEMSPELRRETLEIAMKLHSKEVHNAVSDKLVPDDGCLTKEEDDIDRVFRSNESEHGHGSVGS